MAKPKSLDEKIIILEQWQKEAETLAHSRFEPHEDMSAVKRELAGRKRDIAAIKGHTLKLVLNLLKDK